MTSAQAQKIATIERSTFPTQKTMYEDKDVLEALPYLSSMKEAADKAAPRPQVRDYPTISTIFQEYFHKVLAGGEENEATMKAMDEALNAALEKMK